MKNLKKLPFILSILSFLTLFTSANAEIKVVASIKPIHSLASYLMEGVGKPNLIVDGYASPHGFAMKPSHAKMLQEADLIFWVGEGLENFLEKPLKSIAKKAEKIELLEIKGLQKLKFREKNIFDEHDDHGHKEDKHDDHGHDDDGHKEDDHDGQCGNAPGLREYSISIFRRGPLATGSPAPDRYRYHTQRPPVRATAAEALGHQSHL